MTTINYCETRNETEEKSWKQKATVYHIILLGFLCSCLFAIGVYFRSIYILGFACIAFLIVTYIFFCVMKEDDRLIKNAAHRYVNEVIIPRVENGIVTDKEQMDKEVVAIIHNVTLRVK